MSTRKVAVFVGSRANYGRLRSVCRAITKQDGLELQLILGASFYNADVEFPVASRIQCLINSDDHEGMALTTGVLLSKVSMELARLKPDVVLVHGDRYEVLAVAQAAAYMNIPLAHTEGGEVTGCIDDKIRNAITALADIHFPVTDNSFRQIWNISNSHKIFTVGSTALDGIKHVRDTDKEKHHVVLLYNPETSTYEDFEILINAVEKSKLKNVIVVNPNIDAGSKKILQIVHRSKFNFIKNLEPVEYAKFIYNARLCIGNSSSFIKEASFLGVPSVVVGKRQYGREMDKNCVWVPMDEQAILDAIQKRYDKQYEPSNYFGDGTASEQIAKLLTEVDL